MMLAPAILSLLLFIGMSEAVQKRWVQTWDLNSPNNWKNGHLPCAGKAAILPLYQRSPMFLGDDLTLGSLELSLDGEVIFGDGANMMLDTSTKDNCQDATWTHHGQDKWWDPDAWEHPSFKDPSTSPIPHTHRIPCTRDGAVFTNPEESLYTVHLSPPTISVTSLSIGKKNYTTSEFATYTLTSEGNFMFTGASSSDGAPLYVESPEECRDVTGCLCGTESAASIICGIMSAKCLSPQCNKPIQMTGFCCPVCGAEVTISHSGTLPLASLSALLADHLKTPALQHVSAYAAKMDDGFHHVYFTAVNEKGDYKLAAESFKKKFDQELNAGSSYEALVAYSGNIIPKESNRSVAPHNIGVIVAILITLAICFAIGAAVYHLRKRRATSRFSFMFRRLESSSRRVSVASDMVGGRRASTTSSIFTYNREGGLRFFNPIFNQSMASLAGAGLSSAINENIQVPAGDQVEGQHENPMYTAYQNMSPEERQASEDTLRARERILEAAGELVASMESSPILNKDVKTIGPTSDLGVIEEEREPKTDASDLNETTDNGTEETNDKNSNPLESFNVSSLQKDKTDGDVLIDDSQSEVKLDDSEDKTCTTNVSLQIESDSSTDAVKSELTAKDPINIEEKEIDGSVTKQDLTETEDTQGHPASSLNLENYSTSSSSDDDASFTPKNLEGFTPLVELN
ncbi:uncharacterized protein LOC121858266 isoform X2 [Homarus americanus]|uniref:uncharacterized protein LOC121858266 isoform X2 n=1 Tax=Homarus americanus TaxID=6706 RepID=UPI001C47081E|nr:uncharacterized protein LOC121858266 isoform X2 [Homarus americanus]